ncbi:tRNA lysidine(34) synthetase TilS [Pelagicoccus sp. SDUM812003]|uniref:tRNA lysidine(34) synthetase TilS n=1 Tax=Pelagicoccus sp. SDUM812003 TaxID=3041267 RepID=UPI00280D6A34|nr:tRNA lysidine(34) synthetase TilS [Pelagicoccus sp. SDUM812003]MDQ8205426.1 tRNA lysidine(34) synthetase TilS [Pelagicoccus sp. SDUM812003]
MDWSKIAERLSLENDYARVPIAVRRCLESESPLFVALSSGADSVFATLWTFAALARRGRTSDMVALHFNHGLRGAESDRDESFAAELASGLGIRFICDRASWSDTAHAVREADARAARLAFFRRAASELGQERAWVVTGHHSDDALETILMRLSRGSGIQGLCAPRPVSEPDGCIQFLRPLLDFSREEIRAALRSAGGDWREDSSNEGGRNYRSRLRDTVLPAWNSACDRSSVLAGIKRSRALLEEDWQALETLSDAAWSEAWDADAKSLSVQALLRFPQGVRRRLLHRLVAASEEMAAELPAPIADGALQAIEARIEESWSVSPRTRLSVTGEFVGIFAAAGRSASSWQGFRLPHGCRAYLPDGAALSSELVEVSRDLFLRLKTGKNNDDLGATIEWTAQQSGAIEVRRRLPGDAFKPHGKSSPRKLKSLFIKRKIPLEERDRLPICALETGEIVWAPGLPPGADRVVTAESCVALRLTYAR